MKIITRITSAIAVSTLITWCLAGVASAVVYDWTNTAGGAWSDAGNWSPAGGPPGIADDVEFDLGSTTYRVLVGPGDNALNVKPRGGGSTITFDMGGAAFTNTGPGDYDIGADPASTVYITNGTMRSADRFRVCSGGDDRKTTLIVTNGGRVSYVGPCGTGGGRRGFPNLIIATPSDSSNPAWSGGAGGFELGTGHPNQTIGTATLQVVNGAFMQAGQIRIAARYRGMVAIALVSGAGSEFREISSSCAIGGGGEGFMVVSNGGFMDFRARLNIGDWFNASNVGAGDALVTGAGSKMVVGRPTSNPYACLIGIRETAGIRSTGRVTVVDNALFLHISEDNSAPISRMEIGTNGLVSIDNAVVVSTTNTIQIKGGAIQGNGTVTGNVEVLLPGSYIDPGGFNATDPHGGTFGSWHAPDTFGTLNIVGDVTFSAGTAYKCFADASNEDLLAVVEEVDASGAWTLEVSGSPGSRTFIVATASNFTAAVVANATVTGLPTHTLVLLNDGSGAESLQLQAIPSAGTVITTK